MAKKSRKRVTRYKKDQSGCMWGLINIFDFRHGRPSQKLLADKKHGSRRVAGAACPDNKLDTLEHSCEINIDANADMQSGTISIDTSKMSVKELMKEEMFVLDQEKQMSSKEEECLKQTVSTQQEGHGKKNRWRRSKMSFDLNDTKSASDKPTHRKHRSLSSLNVDNMVAELCSQTHHQDVNCLNHTQGGEGSQNHSEEEGFSVLEEKLGEATKVLVSHFTDEKNFARDGKVQPSRELSDALNVLNLNKEVFLKLLQDPHSQLVKHIHNLQDHQDDKGEISFERQDEGNNRQSFFWRKFKGLERNSSKKAEDAQDMSKIVVLKPGPVVSQDTGNRCPSPKASPFSFFEFTRKLKHAMRKEQPKVSSVEKVIGGESFGMASPTREHFFIERLPKSSLSSRRRDEVGVGPNEIGFTPEQRISNIYIEAKKHLAEIVGDGGDVDVDFLSRQVPKSLGRMLSYADYSSSPLCSPRNDGDLNLLTSPRGLSPSKECQAGKEMASQQAQEEWNVGHPSLLDEERDNELCTDAEKIVGDAEIPKSEVSEELDPVGTANKSSISAVDRILSQEDAEIITSTDFASEKSISLDTVPELCGPSVTNNEQPMSLNLDIEGNESPSSLFASPSVCPICKEVQDQDAGMDISDKPSPVSVLDPNLNQDDLSPCTAKSLPATQQIQPRKIKFEEQIFSSVPSSRTWVWEEEKHSVFELVKVVMQESGLTWDELLKKFFFLDHILEPSFFDELEFIPDLLFYDPQLLFDLIVEVFDEVRRRDFNGILSSVNIPYIGPEFKGKDLVDVIWERVEWHLQPEKLGRSLDQTIARDYVKPGKWMDLRLDTENIGIGMEEAILEELVGETLLNCFFWNREEEFPVFPVESEENESTVSL